MAVETATTAASAPSIGQALVNLGTATQAFVVAHPVGLAFVGGVLVGAGAYYAVGKYLKKEDSSEAEAEAVPASA